MANLRSVFAGFRRPFAANGEGRLPTCEYNGLLAVGYVLLWLGWLAISGRLGHFGLPQSLPTQVQTYADLVFVALTAAALFGVLRRISRALERIQLRLRVAKNAGGVALWEFHAASDTFRSSVNFMRLHGVNKPDRQSWVNSVHPDDRVTVSESLEHCFLKARPCRCEYRVSLSGDNVRWIQSWGVPVRDRKGEITTVAGVCQDVTEQKRAELEAATYSNAVRSLVSHLQTARESERSMLARDIHDELGQKLTAVKIDLSLLEKQFARKDSTAQATLQSVIQTIDEAIHFVREIATELHPAILDELGLCAAVEWAVDEFEKHCGIACHLSRQIDERRLSKEQTVAAFRILQESLTNVARHSKATEVSVELHSDAHGALLEISDNGVGMVAPPTDPTKHFGVLSMRERALSVGANLTIDGAPGKGVTVRLEIGDPPDGRHDSGW